MILRILFQKINNTNMCIFVSEILFINFLLIYSRKRNFSRETPIKFQIQFKNINYLIQKVETFYERDKIENSMNSMFLK